MGHRFLKAAVILLAAVLAGCPSEPQNAPPATDAGITDPCRMVDCGDRECGIVDGIARCLCPPGTLVAANDACVEPSPMADPCVSADCAPRVCALVGGEVMCLCPPGEFENNAGDCVTPQPPPCADSQCPEGRVCAVIDDAAQCVCPEGLIEDDAGACQQPAPRAPCADVDCGLRLCANDQGAALCVCPLGLVDDGMDGCGPVPVGPCAAAPCMGERQICAVVNGAARCVCAPGFVEDGQGGCGPPAPGPCAEDPCQAPGRSVCAVVATSGLAVCLCDDGLIAAPDGPGCIPDPGPGDPCAPNPCVTPGRTDCHAVDAVAVCRCDPGLIEAPASGDCVAPPDSPCDPNPCNDDGRTRCRPAGDVAICQCDEGLVDGGDACVPPDPCTPNPCDAPARALCRVSDGAAVCDCVPGHREDPDTGDCIPVDPCVPNPCVDIGRTQCQAVGAAAVCSCDPGTVPLADGRCRVPDPCMPNPCAVEGRSICVVDQEAGFTCQCDPGFIEDVVGACVLEPIGGCEDSHLDGDAFEPDECAVEATPLVEGEIRAHTIEPAGDVDWFSIDVEAGHIYRIAVTRAGLSDAVISLYDTDGVRVIRTNDTPESITYEFDAAGTYFIRVRHYSSVRTGGYQVSFEDRGTDDHGDSPDTATLVASDGVPVAGEIETRADHDYFAFEAEAGRIYRGAITRTGLSDGVIGLFGPDGARIRESDSPESITYEFDAAGTYFFRVRHYSTTRTGGYTFTLTDEGTDDHGDDVETATPTVPGEEPMLGRIETPGDHDYFGFEAEVGRIYRGAVTRDGLSDAVIALYGPDGDRIRESDTPEHIGFEANEPGPYAFRVRHWSSTRTGGYSFALSDLGVDDHGDSAETATPLAVDADGAPGNIETNGDNDYFAFAAQPRHVYRIRLTRDSLSDGYLYVYDPAGVRVQQSDTETLYVEANAAGDWVVRVRHYSSVRTGTYTLAVTDLGPDDHGDDMDSATPLVADGNPIAGNIESPNDNDWFTLAAEAGRIYRLALTRVSLSDGYVYLYGPDGETVLRSSNSPESITWEFDDAGRYGFRVRHASSSARGTYTVSVTDEGQDDHGDSALTATDIAADGEDTAGLIETRGDADWFRAPLDGGRVYRIRTAGLDMEMTLYGVDGATRLASTGGSTLDVDVGEAGVYFIRVMADSSSATGAYTVSVVD